ncbi:MAG: hypothetical protein V4543_07525 [Bacteroidota bacterium]
MTKSDAGYQPTDELMAIPTYATVQAGVPARVEEQMLESINIQSALIRNPNTTIAIKVA